MLQQTNETKYKIIGISNYGKEDFNDVLICDNISSYEYGMFIADMMNEKYSGQRSQHYYRLVEQERKLNVRSH